MQKSAFVTGGTGFVGLNLIKWLTAEGWNVTAFHRQTSDLTYLKCFPVQLVMGDLAEFDSVLRAVPEDVDAIFHVASDLSFSSAHNTQQTRVNVDGTRHLVDAAIQRRAKRFVYTSTLGTYGAQNTVLTEESPQLAGRSTINYSHTKWLAEEEVRRGVSKGLNAMIMNPGGIFGPYDKTTWGTFFFLVCDDLLPYVPDEGVMTWCHVDEVAKAHIAAAEKGRPGENYILGGEAADLWTVLSLMAELLNKPLRARRLPTELLMQFARAQAAIAAYTGEPPIYTPEIVEVFAEPYRCSYAKASRELGYQAVPLRNMLSDCYQWLVEEGLLKR